LYLKNEQFFQEGVDKLLDDLDQHVKLFDQIPSRDKLIASYYVWQTQVLPALIHVAHRADIKQRTESLSHDFGAIYTDLSHLPELPRPVLEQLGQLVFAIQTFNLLVPQKEEKEKEEKEKENDAKGNRFFAQWSDVRCSDLSHYLSDLHFSAGLLAFLLQSDDFTKLNCRNLSICFTRLTDFLDLIDRLAFLQNTVALIRADLAIAVRAAVAPQQKGQ
jgi:hypothetical protein